MMLITFAAPHLNDPARPNTWGVNVDWPNGGVDVGGGHNNGNHGWGVNVGWPNGGVNVGGGHNNGNHGWGVNVGWPSGGVNVGGGRNNGNSGWGFNFGSQGKRDIGRCITAFIDNSNVISLLLCCCCLFFHTQSGNFLHQYNADFFLLI